MCHLRPVFQLDLSFSAMPKFQKGETIPIPETDVESNNISNTNEEDKLDSLLYGVDDVPPFLTCITLALQVQAIGL